MINNWYKNTQKGWKSQYGNGGRNKTNIKVAILKENTASLKMIKRDEEKCNILGKWIIRQYLVWTV